MFYTKSLLDRARANMVKYPWAARARDRIVAAARPWVSKSDDELWDLMFGATITRSWMVWSNGHCPSCRQSVPMYNWVIDAINAPWKVACPRCHEQFPKNDFLAFYHSGLDESHIFQYDKADRSLLFNVDHPDADDPLRTFGVDDGNGFVVDPGVLDANAKEKRWRFIGTYLIYGQWKQAVLRGVSNLAAAYAVTGEQLYARKAAILLDRVADVYPDFDFATQAMVYERKGDAGYVSTWHDACAEVDQLALDFDMIRGGLGRDDELVRFLSNKASQHKLPGPKRSIDDIRANIKNLLFRDTLAHPAKIHSNFPRRELAIAKIKMIIGEITTREGVLGELHEAIEKATAVDGVTGEKGLTGYSSYVIHGMAQFIELYARVDAKFLPALLERHPNLRQTYRFHIDTWCFQKYYPQSGDCGHFACAGKHYAGVTFPKAAQGQLGLGASMFSFFFRLHELTNDPAYVQVVYHENGQKLDGLPHDLFHDEPETFQQRVREIVQAHGTTIPLASINKEQWHLAILRSGEGAQARAAWLDYDAGGGHCHHDAMNVGLFAKGLDLMPEFGYPPVHKGSWDCPAVRWYFSHHAHNTVVVDDTAILPARGRETVGATTTLWLDSGPVHAVKTAGGNIISQDQYERSIILIDIDDADFYLVDIFRVAGGKDHAKYQHSHFGRVTTDGLNLKPGPALGNAEFMRNFLTDASAAPGWSADWHIEDRYHLAPERSVKMRYTDLTTGAAASVCEGWVTVGGYNTTEEAWIPRLVVQRRSANGQPLTSTFVSIAEPYEGQPKITAIRRLPLHAEGALCGDSHVALEITLTDGRRDLIVALDADHPKVPFAPDRTEQRDWRVQVARQLHFERRDSHDAVLTRIVC